MIHAQLVRKEQLHAMAKLHMLASFFTAHTYYWGDVHIQNFGRERASQISPAVSAIEEGVAYTFHQDTPVIMPNMLETLWCATNRKTKSGITLGEDQQISVYDALKGITINGAYQYFEEDTKGSIKQGKMCIRDRAIVLGVLLVCMVVLMRYTQEMDIMTFGEEQALSAGVELKKVKFLLIATSALLTGTAVAFVGTIGFIDLIAPHVVRKVFGSSHRWLVPISAVFGGIFMVIADLLSRTVLAPQELPVGAVTALVGAPFFAYVYFKKKKKAV